MIRALQVIDHKNISVVTAAAELKRGSLVTKNGENKVNKTAANATSFGFVDVSANYDGVNAIVNPTDDSFETIKSGALCLYIPVHSGERYATSECASGLTVGDKLATDANGKFAKASTDGAFMYCGTYDDPTGIAMYIVEKL